MPKRFRLQFALLLIFLLSLSGVYALPRVTTQPTDQSVSLGANVSEVVFATGVAPLTYQWRFNDAEIAGATKRTLTLTNVQLANAGGYTILVTDISGSVTSRVARLDVDPTLTVLTMGPIV